MAPQPFVPFLDGAQVEIVGTLGGEVVENRLWFISRFEPIDAVNITNLAAGVAGWWADQMLPLLAQEYVLVRVDAKDWNSDPPPFSFSVLTSLPGLNTSGVHSANVSIRVAFSGASNQTWKNNSNFIPGIPKDGVNGNEYTSTIRDGIFEAYVALIDLAGGFSSSHTWRWVITSRIVDNAYRTEQVSSRTVSPLFPSPYISPRRKRLP